MTAKTSLRLALKDKRWLDAANWTQGAPDAGTFARIAGTRIVSLFLAPSNPSHPAVVGELSVVTSAVTLSDGALQFEPAVSAMGLTYDVNIENGASLTVAASATLSGDEVLAMGLDGTPAILRVLGEVSEDDAIVATGLLTVSGSGHWITGASGMAIGGVNGASLRVVNGGVVDEGRKGLSQYADSLSIGEGAGTGSVLVFGLGSLAAFTEVYVGANGEASLTIANGGVLQDQVGVVALNGDGKVVVSGQGSRWDNFGALTVGEVYPTDSTLSVTNGGEVDWGVGGFHLNDTLRLDGSAMMGGQYIYDGGETTALTGHGDVDLSQDIVIASNWLFSFESVADFDSQRGVALVLYGQITGDDTSELRVASGDVAVENAGNAYGSTQIYGGILEVGATGALGQGVVTFAGGSKTHADLALDGQTRLDNVIAGFGATDRIDIAGFRYADGETLTWTENAAGDGGALTLLNSAVSYALNFSGHYAASAFLLAANSSIGGVTLTLAPTP